MATKIRFRIGDLGEEGMRIAAVLAALIPMTIGRP